MGEACEDSSEVDWWHAVLICVVCAVLGCLACDGGEVGAAESESVCECGPWYFGYVD